MKKAEFDAIITEYIQYRGGIPLSASTIQILKRLIALCDHWEKKGRIDAQRGVFSPPAYDWPEDDSAEIVDLLRECYMDGHNAVKAGEVVDR